MTALAGGDPPQRVSGFLSFASLKTFSPAVPSIPSPIFPKTLFPTTPGVAIYDTGQGTRSQDSFNGIWGGMNSNVTLQVANPVSTLLRHSCGSVSTELDVALASNDSQGLTIGSQSDEVVNRPTLGPSRPRLCCKIAEVRETRASPESTLSLSRRRSRLGTHSSVCLILLVAHPLSLLVSGYFAAPSQLRTLVGKSALRRC